MKLAWLLPLLALVGCGDLPGRPDPSKRFVPPAKVLDFAKLFAKNCAGCHGRSGELGPALPLKDAIFLAIVPDEELTRVVARGRKGTSMPAFAKSHGGTLTDEQVDVLTKGLREHWSDPGLKTKDWPEYRLPEQKGDATRGQAVFARACAGCHGEKGQGADCAGAIRDPAFLALASEQFLRRIIITGRTDLGMPDCSEGEGRPLSPSEINDLVALLMSWNKP